MWKKTLISLSLAHQNIRARLFHTLLSILGIVIGVAALVTVLSLIDGLEKFAQDQLTQTTTLNSILIESNPYKFSDNLRLKKENYEVLNYNDIEKLKSALSLPAEVYLSFRLSEEVAVADVEQAIGASIIAQAAPRAADTHIKLGKYFTHEDVEVGNKVAYVKDILLQFLAESVTVSVFGSFLGLIMGILGTLVIVPIIKAVVEVPFQAAYTWNTFVVISIIAVVIGIVFGTYPAMQAAKLDPVEAIRRE